MAYSSSVRLTWEIFSITVSVEGPAARRTGRLKTRRVLSAAPPRVPTSVRHVELDSEVSGGASGAVAGREDDPAYGLDFPDDAGNSRGGQEAVVSDNQPADLNNDEQRQSISQSGEKKIK